MNNANLNLTLCLMQAARTIISQIEFSFYLAKTLPSYHDY
jgi:hypothetical protein